MPIWGCNKNNNLCFILGSNKKKIKINHIKKNGRIKPQISNEYFQNNKKFAKTGLNNKKASNAILFHEKTVHFAPINKSSNLRVSSEFTIFSN